MAAASEGTGASRWASRNVASVSIRRKVALAVALGFVCWLAALSGFGNRLLLSVFTAGLVVLVAWFVLHWLHCRRFSRFGPELRYATSILLNRAKWANLVEILDLSVDASLRRSRVSRAYGVARGVAWGARRSVRYIPTVVQTIAAPYGLAVIVAGAPGQSRESWGRRCGQLRSALRVRDVTVSEPRPGIFELQLRVRDPLASPTALAAVVPSRGWWLPLGVDERGEVVAAQCGNVSGVVVGGVPGSGKSNWLTFALASLASRDDVQWLLIDGKQGYDLEPLAARAYRYISGEGAGDLEIVKDALLDVQMLMRERLGLARELYGHANLWSVGPSREHPAVFVVIDECQSYLDAKALVSKELKAIGAEIEAIVRDLVKRGRSAGIVIILSTQRPTAESIPTSTRDNCALRVCFSVRTREAATAVLGDFSTDSAASPIGAPSGVGVSFVDGCNARFRSPFVPETVVRKHICAVADLTKNPLDLLCAEVMNFVDEAGSDFREPSQTDPRCSDTSRPRPAREPMD